jgi:hypothetical protein
MIRSLIGKAAIASFALVAATSAVQAQQSGTVSFTSGIQVTSTDANGSLQPGGCCVLLDFLTGAGAAGLSTGEVRVLGASSGFFGPLTDGQTGTISDLVVGPVNTTVLTAPIFLQVGGYTFSGATFAPGNVGSILLEATANGTRATMNINGTVAGPGIAGPANFFGILTTQFTALYGANGELLINRPTPEQLFAYVDAGNVLRTSTSMEVSATIVPEPSTYALMGLGLAGMAFFARRRRLV